MTSRECLVLLGSKRRIRTGCAATIGVCHYDSSIGSAFVARFTAPTVLPLGLDSLFPSLHPSVSMLTPRRTGTWTS